MTRLDVVIHEKEKKKIKKNLKKYDHIRCSHTWKRKEEKSN